VLSELPVYFNIDINYRKLAWSYDPESYAGGSVSAGRVSHAGNVKGDDPDKNEYSGPPGLGWGWG
jgi:hypothetical protein